MTETMPALEELPDSCPDSVVRDAAVLTANSLAELVGYIKGR
jgi:hypothetical protein